MVVGERKRRKGERARGVVREGSVIKKREKRVGKSEGKKEGEEGNIKGE